MYRRQKQVECQERRIILVGKTGNGKSSTGNSILRKNAFTEKMSPNAVTENCSMKTSTDLSRDKRYRIVDTPGLLDTSKRVGERALDIQQSVEICPDPHVFLIVFSAKNRMTEDERFTIDVLRIIFGEKVFNHAIVVFTHGDMLDSEDEFKKFWTQNEILVSLIEKCGNRVVKIENNDDFYGYNEGREHIVNMIEDLTDSGKKYYSYKYMDTHRSVLEEHVQNYVGKKNIHDEITDIVNTLAKKIDRQIWKKMLFGGVLIAGGAMGAGYMAGANAIAASGLGATVLGNAAAIGGAVFRTAGSVTGAMATSRVGSALIANGATVGGAVVSTAWNVATKIRFW